ncbi:MAG: HRDC domain-containing protein [Deltaproteobacteria bacterium]|nr:HRDC domain-containing protein [Deltaproteobacteria bacterium]
MTIQYKFFTIPLKATREVETELNHFLRSQRVLTVHREFVSQGENSFWTMAVEYMSDGNTPQKTTGKKRVDYREVLSSEDFALFVKLRDWRKQAAEKEAVPVYTIFTNEQLAEMAKRKVKSKADLKEISGVGEARAKNYGDAVLGIMAGNCIELEAESRANETNR